MKAFYRIQKQIYPVGSRVRLKAKCPTELRPYLEIIGIVLSNQGEYTTVSFDGMGVSVHTGHLEGA